MTKNGIDSYRFASGKEPTDEMLEQIMKEVAEEARTSNRKATEKYWSRLQQDIIEKQDEWGEIIKSLANGLQ